MTSLQNNKKNLLNSHASATIKAYQKVLKAKQEFLKSLSKKDLRDKVLDWLFSNDLSFTQKILTIENPLTINIINSMYNEVNIDKRVTFSFSKKEDNSQIPIYSSFPANNSNCDFEYKIHHFLDFSSKYNNEPKKVCVAFIKQIQFFTFSGQPYFENMCLSSTFIKDRNSFITGIDLIDKEFFTSFPKVEYDNLNKITYIKLCDRLYTDEKTNNYDENSNDDESNNNTNTINTIESVLSTNNYNLAEIFLFFLEQVVMIRYLLYLDNHLIYSFKINTKEYTLFFDENTELFKYIGDNVNKKGEGIFDSINFDTILDSTIKNPQIHELIKLKTRKEYGHYKSYYANSKTSMYNKKNPVFDSNDGSKFKSSVISRLRYSVSEFIDKMYYISLRRIWTFDSFLAYSLYEDLNKQYKEKVFQELLNDMDNDFDNNNKKRKKNNKGKANNKKSKKKVNKGNDIEEIIDTISITNSINNKNAFNEINKMNTFNNTNINSNSKAVTSFENDNVKVKSVSNTNVNADYKNKEYFDELFGSENENQSSVVKNVYNTDKEYSGVNNKQEYMENNEEDLYFIDTEIKNLESSKLDKLQSQEENINNDFNKDALINKEANISTANNDFDNTASIKNSDNQQELSTFNKANIYYQNINTNLTNNTNTEEINTNNTNTENTFSNAELNDISTISSIINKNNNNNSNSLVTRQLQSTTMTTENEQVDFCNDNQQSSFININNNSNSKKDKKQKQQQIKQKFFLYDTSKLNKKNLSFKSINVVNHAKCLVKKFSKFDECQSPFLFWQRLHNDIIDFSLNVVDNISIVRPFKIEIIEKFKIDLFNNLKNITNIIVYGSFATDLSIEFSDVDLRIVLDDKSNFNVEINNFVEFCNNNNIFEYVKPITTASVPVVKLCIDLFKFDSGNKKFSEKLEKLKQIKNKDIVKELTMLKFDITFSKMNSPEMKEVTDSISYIQKFCIKYPDLVPLIFIMKHYLNKSMFNSAYNGGMSSFCLFVVVLAFKLFQKNIVKKEVTYNLGTMLYDMIDFYGNSFSFLKYKVDINNYNGK